jgi:hypothetical protein
MITLVGGNVQGPSNVVVPRGTLQLQLNVDATIIPDGGIVFANVPAFFSFDASGNLIPPCPIWSNAELSPQNQNGLGTWYSAAFFDINGAQVSRPGLTFQFTQGSGAVVDISTMVGSSSTGGNVMYYPQPALLQANNTFTGSESHSGTETFSGPVVFSGPVSGLNPGLVSKLNGIIFVDGVTYATIQAAINALPTAGGTVVLPDNINPTLTAVVSINKPVHLFLGANTITCTMTDPGQFTGAFNITSDNVEIEGVGPETLITQGNAANIECAIGINDSGNIRIHGVKVDWNDVNQTNAAGYYSCISSQAGSHDIRIYDCEFTRGGDRAIDIRGASRVWIERNSFYQTGLFTLHAPSAGNSVSVDLDVTMQSTDVWLSHNYVAQQGDAFAAAHGRRIHIIGNTIRGAADFGLTPTDVESGIDASGNVDCEVSGNHCINVRGPQLSVQGSLVGSTNYVPRNVRVENNTFVANTTAGGLPATEPRVVMGMYGCAGQAENIMFVGNSFDGVILQIDTTKYLSITDNIFCNVLYPPSQIAIVLDQVTTAGHGIMADFSISNNIFLTDNATTQTTVYVTAAVTTPGQVLYTNNLQDSTIPNGFTSANPINFATLVNAKRIFGGGTAINTSNISFSGWGSGASLYFAIGTDLAAQISIQPGSGPSAYPTVTYTFTDGTFTNQPIVVVCRADGDAPYGDWFVQSVSATQVVFQGNFTPGAGPMALAFVAIGQ